MNEAIRKKQPNLWRNNSFLKLWAGQSVSLFGSSITTLAIPLLAVSQLQASPAQMGVLQMVQYLPFLVFGLFAGVWVDRLPRRPILIVTDLGRAAALASIPVAAFYGWLNINLLYGIVFLVGVFNLLFEAAYAAFLPSLVPAQQLADGNSKLQTSAAAAETAGPGLAGWLIQVGSASFALVVDALSFLVSAAALVATHVSEPKATSVKSQRNMLYDLKEGLSVVLSNPYIRPLTLCSASANTFINMYMAIYILFLTRHLGLNPAQIGLLYSVAGVGGLLGAMSASTVAHRLGVGRAIIAESVIVGVALTALSLFSLLGVKALPLLAVAHALWGFWTPVYTVNAQTLRQVLTPTHLLGRVTASSRFISWGAATCGFLIGGVVAEKIGLFPTLVSAGIGLLLSALWVLLSPLRSLVSMPTATDPYNLKSREV